jgi:hypothetical protein
MPDLGFIFLSFLVGASVGLVWGIKKFYPIHQLSRLKNQLTGNGPERAGLRRVTKVTDIPDEFDYRILAIGQSHAAGCGQGLGKAEGAYDLSVLDSNIVPLCDPILNVPSDGGSVWTRLAQTIVAASGKRPLFCSIAVPGCSIRRFAPGGNLHARLHYARDAFPKPPTHILLWIGERDAELGTPPEKFQANVEALIQSLRSFGWEAPIYIAQSTFRNGTSDSVIRTAQLPENYGKELGVFAGPDTDTLSLEYRYDGIHFNEAGLKSAAEMWYGAIFDSPQR